MIYKCYSYSITRSTLQHGSFKPCPMVSLTSLLSCLQTGCLAPTLMTTATRVTSTASAIIWMRWVRFMGRNTTRSTSPMMWSLPSMKLLAIYPNRHEQADPWRPTEYTRWREQGDRRALICRMFFFLARGCHSDEVYIVVRLEPIVRCKCTIWGGGTQPTHTASRYH